MSTERDGPQKVPGMVRLGEDQSGRAVLAAPYTEAMAHDTLGKGLAVKTEPESRGDGEGTPDPDTETNTTSDPGGPIRRFNDVFTDLGSVQLEAIGLDGFELASAAATLRDEMYRSEFPVVSPRFEVKCADEECATEYDRTVDFCVRCAREEMMEDGIAAPPTEPDDIPEEYTDHPVRPPAPSEKREARQLAESVNKEGQSLRELFKSLEDDQSRLGVSTLVVKKTYAVAAGDSVAYNRGEVIYEDTEELVRGDPKRMVPVVDENGRVGGYWWTCPVHRQESLTTQPKHEDGEVACAECGAELREVFFVEQDKARYSASSKPEKFYFEDEVITWARYYPRLHGLDGLSPLHHLWLKQAILHWMDVYGAAYYDPDSDKYPNKFMVVHTTNPKAWERQFDKAEEDAAENPYSEQIMMNEYSGESNSTPEVQVIDLMSDELLGQDQQIKDQYKQDIRSAFGVTNIFDSEMKDAGGLNNEGLQLEVTDRSVATAMNDTSEGPLDELAKTLGIEDHSFEFIPSRESDASELQEQVQLGEKAADAGLDASFEDGRTEIADGDFDAGEEGGDEGGLAGLFGGSNATDSPEGVAEKFDPMTSAHDLDPATGEGVCSNTGKAIEAETMGDLTEDCPHCGEALSHVPATDEKAVGDDEWSAEMRTFRVVPGEGDDMDWDSPVEDPVIGVGVDFPNSPVYVDWHNKVFPDELTHPHVSEYGSVDDLQKATGNRVVDYGPPAGGTTEKASSPVVFGNVGGDPFDTEEELEDFIRDLESAGATVMLGDEPHERATGIHDRPVIAYGISLGEAEAMWGKYNEDAAALTGPSLEGEEGKASVGESGARHKSDWVPYEGPRGGEGWLDPDTGSVEYSEDPPGPVDEAAEALGDTLSVLERPTAKKAAEAFANLPAERQTQFARVLPQVSRAAGVQITKAMAKFGPQALQSLVTMLGEEGEPEATHKSDEKARQVRRLDDAFKHIVWADETTKAEPFWDEDEDVPDFVLEVIDDVVEQSVWPDVESLPGDVSDRLADIIRESLTQPQGWSLGSIAQNIADEFGVPYDKAQLVGRTEAATVLNEAREEGYRRAPGGLEGRVFEWIGPQDHRTTDACEWLKDATEGGVPYARLIELEKEATDRFFERLDFRKHTIHPNERHTFVETFKLDHAGAAGPIEIEHKLSSRMPVGTFREVEA